MELSNAMTSDNKNQSKVSVSPTSAKTSDNQWLQDFHPEINQMDNYLRVWQWCSIVQ
jgi:hypothetical protein